MGPETANLVYLTTAEVLFKQKKGRSLLANILKTLDCGCVCVYIALRDVVTDFKTDVMKMDSTSVSLQNTC